MGKKREKRSISQVARGIVGNVFQVAGDVVIQKLKVPKQLIGGLVVGLLLLLVITLLLGWGVGTLNRFYWR